MWSWAQDRLRRPISDIRPVPGGRTDSIFAVLTDDGARSVLRYLPAERWGITGREHVRSEARGWHLMFTSALPIPRLIATGGRDPVGGGYVNLSSWLSGDVRLGRLESVAIRELARVAAAIHHQPVPPYLRPDSVPVLGARRPGDPDLECSAGPSGPVRSRCSPPHPRHRRTSWSTGTSTSATCCGPVTG